MSTKTGNHLTTSQQRDSALARHLPEPFPCPICGGVVTGFTWEIIRGRPIHSVQCTTSKCPGGTTLSIDEWMSYTSALAAVAS